jgi:transcription-repair coupling factor (superfamily II helicase)
MNSANLFESIKYNRDDFRVLLVENNKEAKRALGVFEYLGKSAYVLPDIRLLPGDDARSYMQDIATAFYTLGEFYSNKGSFLIAPFRTLTIPMPDAKYLQSFTIEFGDSLDLQELKDKLYFWGYSFVDVVSAPLEVSFRGEIIDIFPPNYQNPIRVGLFDNEVEEIREFDISTQKRFSQELDKIIINAAFLSLDKSSFEALEQRVQRSPYNSFVKDIASLGIWNLGELSINFLKRFKHILASKALVSEIEDYYELNSQNEPLIAKDSFEGLFLSEAKEYRELEVIDINHTISANSDKKITIVAKNETAIRASGVVDLAKLNIKYCSCYLNIGSRDELILSLNKEEKKRKIKKPTLILDEIKVGEYVVHEDYGVGVFKGIKKREVLGRFKDFVEIEYQNEEMLYIPVEYLDVIDRYIAPSGSLPAIDRLGKSSFAKLKGKVKEKLFAIARELMEISAKRLLKEGKEIVVDSNLQQLFIKEAGFSHTSDQIRAIDDILDELSSGKIMDRLLSADVGFGKTEVAMNAIFAVVKSGHQAAVVVPTTLLSMQHYNSLKERFAKWNIKIGKLDRFTSTKEKKELLIALEQGLIDVVVGTHGVVNAKFKDLALVVIDEEHKFGVKQKEALKKLTINTHLLSMSATPIPRSLNMALSHIKTFSEIYTPPTTRAGVRTFVKNFDIVSIKEAITRELRRGGQIFYVYNSIAGLEDKKRELLEAMPNLRITMLHSKVSAAQSEKEMVKFANREYDLLLSTSIIESGIHIPSVNTIIIDGAQKFGIADLHQLRGRVGRGGKEGYCYYFVDNKEALNENAKRRLLALESHSELGSGAILAMHDLEIRGGGNLVGEAQSGHIKQIGYSLYLRMLEDAIRVLSGKVDESEDVEIKLNVDAYLSDELISEDRLRLELYRRLSKANSLDEIYEIEDEIADRFGKIDKLTKQFIDLIVIKIIARELDIKKISSYEQNIFIELKDESKDRLVLKSPTKDSDDIIKTTLDKLRLLMNN